MKTVIYKTKELQQILKDFFTLTGIRITIFNDHFQEILAYPQNILPCCQILRQDPLAKNHCAESDQKACQTVIHKTDAYIYPCPFGLTEAIAPIHLNGMIVGFLMFGHVLLYDNHKQAVREILHKCAAYHLDEQALTEELSKMPLISIDYLKAAARMMATFSEHLCYRNMILLQKNLPIQINAFIKDHLRDDLNIQTICNHFQIGKTQLCNLSRKAYGMGPASYIRHLRLQTAQKLLLEAPHLSVSQVAEQAGFGDYNYFINLFRRTNHITPREYRHCMGKEYLASKQK